MKKHLLTLIAVLFGCVMYAATPLQMGEVFTVKDGGSDVWSITPTESGVMKIVGDNGNGEWIGSCLVVYDDESMSNEIQKYNWSYYEVNVEAGHTYYIKNFNLTFVDYKGHCTMAEAFKFKSCVPAEGTPFYIVGDTEAYFYFTQKSATFKTGELECNGQKVNIYNFVDQNELIQSGIFTYTEIGSSGIVNYNGNVVGHTNNDGFSIPFLSSTGLGYNNIIYDWLSTGKVEPGMNMTIKLHGVCSGNGELLNGDGELEAHWLVADLPTTLEKSTLPETFLSYWAPGNEAGMAVFEFSNNIKSAQAIIGMGSAEASDRFEGEVPVIVEGNKVKVDFTGEKRDAKNMGLKATYPDMELMVYNVIDVNGNGTFAGGQGLLSSYRFEIPYRDVSGEVSFEITPSSGASLDKHNSIEIWYDDPKQIIEADGVEVIYYTPELQKETITEYVEGQKVTREVEVEVNQEHTIFYSDKDLGTNWNVGIDGTTITIPVTDEMRKARNIYVGLHIVKNHDGREHNIVAYYNTQLLHQFEVAQHADPINESTVDRLAEVYLTLGSTYAINPAKAAVTVTSKTSVQYKGTGKIVSDGRTNAMIVLDEPVTEEGQYTITIQEGAVGDYIYGLSTYVTGNSNEEVSLSYTVSGKYAGKEIAAEPEAYSTLKKLESVKVTYFNYNTVAPTWNPDAEPYILKDNNIDHPLECHFVEEAGPNNYVTIIVNEPITENGEYTLVIPVGAVCNAANGNSIEKEYKFEYTVKNDAVIVPVKPTVNPAEGEVDEIESITIDFGQKVTLVEPSEDNNFFVPQPILLSSNDNGMTLYCTGILSLGEKEGEVIWTASTKAVAGCEATFNIPEGCIKLADGTLNKEYNYSFTISGNNEVKLAIASCTPAAEAEVEELSEMVITFDQPVEFDDWSKMVAINNASWTQFAEGTLTATDDPCTVKIVFDDPIKNFGPSTITLNAYTFKTGKGYYTQTLFINLTIGEEKGQGNNEPVEDEKIVITPSTLEPVSSLKYFEISFGGYVGAWVEEPIVLADVFDNAVSSAKYLSGQNADGESFWELDKANTYSITLSTEVKEAGVYILSIPAMCEKPDGGVVLRELYYMFEVDPAVGIASVKKLDASDAYTLGGIKTNITGKPGIYIVGGKKIVIK